MTNELRSFIAPQDIVGVEFECGHCHARLLYKLPDRPVRIAFQCPNCNERFYDANRQGDIEEFFRLMAGLPRFAKDAKATVRIQISMPATGTQG